MSALTRQVLPLAIVVTALSLGCGKEGGGVGPGGNIHYHEVNAFPNLTFAQPVDLKAPPDATNRLFVVERAGVVRVFNNDPAVERATVFLDIRDRVDADFNEEGLLGLAFHPLYEQNGYFYLYHNETLSPDRTQLVRYQRSATDPNAADRNSDLVMLLIPQPFANHNGGAVAFGPDDGYLYIGVGDGGGANDLDNNAQTRSNLLGDILRIDVNGRQGPLNYAIPPDNPFVGNQQGWREEIWAWGLRNPWRISFDPATGRLWAGDVGQNALEEVDVIRGGRNYGWAIMEGTECRADPNCDQTGLELPVWQYAHGGGGRAVTGGYVYRGRRLLGLVGAYVYADFVTGEIWALRYDGSSVDNQLLVDTDLAISSFGIDAAGELYFCAFDGGIYALEAVEESQ